MNPALYDFLFGRFFLLPFSKRQHFAQFLFFKKGLMHNRHINSNKNLPFVLVKATIFNPKIRGDVLRGWDDEVYEEPSPRSDGYAHG